MGWDWLLFAIVAGWFVTLVVWSVVEWVDRVEVSDLQAKVEVWRRIVKHRIGGNE